LIHIKLGGAVVEKIAGTLCGYGIRICSAQPILDVPIWFGICVAGLAGGLFLPEISFALSFVSSTI